MNNLIYYSFIICLSASVFYIGYEAGDSNYKRNYRNMFDDEQDYTKYSVSFSDELVQQLNTLYLKTEENEFGVCLIGDVNQETIFLYDYSHYRTGDERSVIWDDCTGKNELGFLHKHYEEDSAKETTQSFQDVYASFLGIRLNQNKLSVIMFGENKFQVFTNARYLRGQVVS